MKFEFIKHRKIFYGLSIAITLVCLFSFFAWGLKPGIDFVGGTRWQVDFKNGAPEHTVLEETLKANNINDAVIDYSGGQSVIMRLKTITEAEHQQLLSVLQEKFQNVEDKNFSSIGPTIGAELKRRALWAVFLVCLGILLYISYAFRKTSLRIPSYRYGALAILALVHDVIAMIGLYAFLGHFGNVEINSYFIVSILIVMGYSVHDTIVVFDRVRESFRFQSVKAEVPVVVNDAINSTMARSINTSLTAILSLMGLYFWGPPSIKIFVLAMMFGIFIGTYSSIFIASSLLVDWNQNRSKKKA
ncbi:MAG: protein translocase subunit SecF [Candidatus Parcubacteria bacterium]|nr:protein translocase subunit SecF [Candidatus Parcubacteria bacterium]